MEKYYINYHTGAGNEYVEDTLENAMKIADDGAAYTQEGITIEDTKGNTVAVRQWWGTGFDPEESEATEDEVIQFGDFGYYEAWRMF